jgi:O6-methylguanine-DNA--protein-cysteine methyltransferase
MQTFITGNTNLETNFEQSKWLPLHEIPFGERTEFEETKS